MTLGRPPFHAPLHASLLAVGRAGLLLVAVRNTASVDGGSVSSRADELHGAMRGGPPTPPFESPRFTRIALPCCSGPDNLVAIRQERLQLFSKAGRAAYIGTRDNVHVLVTAFLSGS